MDIHLYSKWNPRRFQEVVKDFDKTIELLGSHGESLEIWAEQKQVAQKPIHVRRNAKFYGKFEGQFVLHGDISVTFENATITKPDAMRYTIIMANDFVGKLYIRRSKVSAGPNAGDVALAGMGNEQGVDQVTLDHVNISGAIFYANTLNLYSDVNIEHSNESDVVCHELYTENCGLYLKNASLKHDIDKVPFDVICIDGKCVLSGGFSISKLEVDDTQKSLELGVLTGHFKEKSIYEIGQVEYKSGHKNVTSFYVKHAKLHILDGISQNIKWRVTDTDIGLEAIMDYSKWDVEEGVTIAIDNGAQTSLSQNDDVHIVKKKRGNAMSDGPGSVFDEADLTGLGTYEKPKAAMDEINEMIGQERVKEQLHDFIAKSAADKLREERGLKSGATITRNMVFAGPPGVGKTAFARLIGRALFEQGALPEDKFVEVSAVNDLVAGYIGQTAPQTHEVASRAYGGVLFVDEAYALAKDDNGQFGAKAIEQLLKEADDHRDELVIILAGYEEDMQNMMENENAGLKRRFPFVINFESYSQEQLMDIFKLMVKNTGSKIEESLLGSRPLQELVTSYADANANAGGVRNFVDALILARDKRVAKKGANASNNDLILITSEDLVQVYQKRVAELQRQAEAMAKVEQGVQKEGAVGEV